MYAGYNTNGFAHHRIEDALAILSELGFTGAAITLEHDLLDPPNPQGVSACAKRLKPLLKATGLKPTIESGARFILDPRHKHQPTLLSSRPDERSRRIDFIKAAIDVANELNAECVSLWSGAPDDGAEHHEHFDRLVSSLGDLCNYADARGVRLAFEPEPGMFVATMAEFARLHRALDHPRFGLTLDVGHVHCLEDGDVSEHLARWRDVLWNLHVEDMRRGVHEHLMFGDGEMDFEAVFTALRRINYAGPVHVELPRHSHNATESARHAMEFLRRFL